MPLTMSPGLPVRISYESGDGSRHAALLMTVTSLDAYRGLVENGFHARLVEHLLKVWARDKLGPDARYVSTEVDGVEQPD